MSDEALHTYLRDHLAGAAFGSDLARTLESEGDDDVAQTMATVAGAIEEDRETLLEVMDAVGAGRNPVKEAVAWVGEKVGRAKFSGLTMGDDALGTFMGLEALYLGIHGKRALWIALREDDDGRLSEVDLVRLITRAEEQIETVEQLRRRHVRPALSSS